MKNYIGIQRKFLQAYRSLLFYVPAITKNYSLQESYSTINCNMLHIRMDVGIFVANDVLELRQKRQDIVVDDVLDITLKLYEQRLRSKACGFGSKEPGSIPLSL